MKTYLDCFPCFLSQALRAARIATDDQKKIKDVLDEVGMMLREIPLESSPPESGRMIYHKISEITGNLDPYKEIKKENTKKALSFYRTALEANSSDYHTWLGIAACHAGQGDLEGAVQGYQKAIAIDPERAQAYLYLGQVYLGKELFADALEPLQRAVELQPGWTEARLELGKTYLFLDDCQGAETHFRQVLGVEPENPDAQQGMAACEGE